MQGNSFVTLINMLQSFKIKKEHKKEQQQQKKKMHL